MEEQAHNIKMDCGEIFGKNMSHSQNSPRAIRQNVDKQYGSKISKIVAYNARVIALKIIVVDRAMQYKQVCDYRAESLQTHPGSTVEIDFKNCREEGRQP